MAQNGVVRFAGNLDPGAQEFRPTYPAHIPFLTPQPFYPAQPHQPEIMYQLQPTYLTPPLPQPPPPTAVIPPSLPPPAAAPTRAVLLSSVPPEVSESGVRRELEIFGDVRAVQMERVRESIVTVHFYDLRAACAALDAVREQHMQHQHRLRVHYTSIWARNNPAIGLGLEALAGPPPQPPPAPGLILGRAVWAQFTTPVTHAFPDGHNQGTIVIFNLDPNVSALTLKDIFQAFGAVKELRETPMKRQQRFVEFYDVRDASRALIEMNGKEINGRTVMIEFSRPGGHSHKKQHHQPPPNFHRTKTIPPPPPPPAPPSYPSRHRRTSPRQRAVSGPNRRRCSSSSEESLETGTMMSTLTLRDEEKNTSYSVGKKKQQHQQQQTSKAGRSWKGRQKNFDPRFMIKEEAIVEATSDRKDSRTTVMIKNIPNKYSQKLLLNMLDNHCIHCNEQISNAGGDQPLSSYDFVYLPIDFNNKCNVGYGFVNMTSPEATLRLYKAFHHQHWEVFNSRKICEVTYARVQGLEALKEHFKNSKFACENDEYLPVVFTPPRDGRHLTAPLPIVLTSTPHLHHDHDDDDDDDEDEEDGGDFTSASTTPTTFPSSSDFPQDDVNPAEHDAINDNDDDDQ